MDGHSDRCALELSDAHVDVLGYACLVAIMSMGFGYHRVSGACWASAGALVDGLKVMGAHKIVVLAPYVKPLTKLVVDYIANEGYVNRHRIGTLHDFGLSV
jgi:maleate isomerase